MAKISSSNITSPLVKQQTPLRSVLSSIVDDSEIDRAPIDVSSDPPSSPVFGNQLGYWEYLETKANTEQKDHAVNNEVIPKREAIADDGAVTNAVTEDGAITNDQAMADHKAEATTTTGTESGHNLPQTSSNETDKVTIKIDMNYGNHGAPVINFNFHTKARKRRGSEGTHGQAKRMKKDLDHDLM